jgi:hemolysin activation/secretion protein
LKPGPAMSAASRPWLALLPALLSAAAAGAQPAGGGGDDGAAGLERPSGAIPFASTEGSLVRLPAIDISTITVEGSSVFAPGELDAFTASYEGRSVSLEELHELRHALSAAYVERGYVSSGFVIPDQQVENGAVTLRAIEGGLTDVVVIGNRRLRARTIERRIERYVDFPLDIAALQTSLRVLQEEPLVEHVNAQLLPGQALGESYLRVAVTERRPFELTVSAANDRAPSVGEDRGTLGLTWHGLVGNGDVLSGQFGFTAGVADNQLAYRAPLTAGGAALDVLIAEQQADIVEAPFDDIDIRSDLTMWHVTVSKPFLRSANRSLRGLLGFEHKRSRSSLLGMPFSFSPGDIDGRATGSAVSLGAEWTQRGPSHAWSARGTVHVGVDALDATINPQGPDSEFSVFLAQFQLLRNVEWRASRIVARALVQHAFDPLLAVYKLPVGGRYSVRGYRENRFVRDNGVAASIEYQVPLLVDETGRARTQLRLAVFADYGASWDEDDALVTARKERIASAGLGLIWNPLPSFRAEVYWGEDLDGHRSAGNALQDKGIHYGLSFARAF